MRSCAFFGNRNSSGRIKDKLISEVTKLIIEEEVDTFYVGNHGSFDGIVCKILNDLSKTYDFNYYIVLAYLPIKGGDPLISDFSHTIIPDGIESVPPRFAILFRNRWMIDRSDLVISHIKNEIGSGAAKAVGYALKQKKKLITI